MSAQHVNRLHIRNRRMSPPSGCSDVSYHSCVGSVRMSAHRCRSRNPNRISPTCIIMIMNNKYNKNHNTNKNNKYDDYDYVYCGDNDNNKK